MHCFSLVAPVVLLLVGAPALCVLTPLAAAQVTVSPGAVEATLAAGEQAEVLVAVTNEGATPVELFAVPLPEGGATDDVGALLFYTLRVADGGLAMTSDGRLFAATFGGSGDTFEYTPDLMIVREFESPRTDFASNTTGLAWMPPEHAPPGHPDGTLWWLDVDTDCFQGTCTVETTLLIEGDLDGNETGRTVVLTTGPGTPGPPSLDRGIPLSLAYDPEAVGLSGTPGLFYYVDYVNEDIYAVDVEGTVAEGYPAPLVDFDPEDENNLIQAGLGAARGEDGAAYLDLGVVVPEDTRYERVAVTDRRGRVTGVETPLGGLAAPDGEGELLQVSGVLRSRLDPSVLYLAVRTADPEFGSDPWIYAVRAAPLPPRWLRAAAAAPASLTVAPGETGTLAVRLDAEGLPVGAYAGLLELRSGGPNGEAVAEVPVALTVTEATASEVGPEPEEAPLSVYPNPSAGRVTVVLTLAEAAEVRVAVFDVLGREVGVLHDEALAGGQHTLVLDVGRLPAGLYVVRVMGSGIAETQRLTVVR